MFAFEPFSGLLDDAVKGESNEARNLSAITRLIQRFGFFLPENHGHGEETIADASLFFSRYLRLWFENGVNEYEDEERYAPSGSVSFLNIHQSKGLEYPVVIVPSLEDYPRWQAESDLITRVVETASGRKPCEPMNDTKDFDFWRKYYTAFSRAETLLVLASRWGEMRYPRLSVRSWSGFLSTMRRPQTTSIFNAVRWGGMYVSRVSPSRRRSLFTKNVR